MFIGNKAIKTINSKINGKVEVIRSLAFGTYISVGGLTQSGGIVYEIWKKTLKKVKRQKKVINNCLILGLGGGSVSILVKKFWPNVKIVGVEIDPIMVKLGKEFLSLKDVDIKINDAYDFCLKTSKLNEKYGLVIVDLYIDDKFPDKFDSLKFINLTRSIVSKEGIIVFNKLYYGEKRKKSLNFAKKVEEVYKNVEYFHPEANLMLICS
ncbi:MAG: hypothetical protein ABIJ05_05030 [Patescibacteria group bacterium]